MFYKILFIITLGYTALNSEEQFTFNYYFNDYLLGDEIVAVEFPAAPAQKEFQGMQVYSGECEGARFSLSALPIPNSQFELQSSIDFFVDSLKKSQSRNFQSMEHKDGIYTLAWIEKDQLARLSILKSAYFIYFLEITGDDEGEQAAAFTQSFRIVNGFSFS